jgi:hypothetical protein
MTSRAAMTLVPGVAEQQREEVGVEVGRVDGTAQGVGRRDQLGIELLLGVRRLGDSSAGRRVSALLAMSLSGPARILSR